MRLNSLGFISASIASAYMALLFLAMPCNAMIQTAAPGQSVGDTLTLGEDCDPDISLEVPASVVDWVLVPIADNQKQITIRVEANDGWTLAVSSNRPDGRMAQYDPVAESYIPDGRSLSYPLKISMPGCAGHPAAWEVDLSSPGIIQQMDGSRGGAPLVMIATLHQSVTWEDEPSSDEFVYRIDLLFQVTPLD
jgi:hypothetical protein